MFEILTVSLLFFHNTNLLINSFYTILFYKIHFLYNIITSQQYPYKVLFHNNNYLQCYSSTVLIVKNNFFQKILPSIIPYSIKGNTNSSARGIQDESCIALCWHADVGLFSVD